MNDRLTELQRKRMLRRKRQRMFYLILSAVLIFLLIFNVVFLILNVRGARKNASESERILREEPQTSGAEVVPIHFELDTSEAPEETTTAPETEAPDEYKSDPRYEAISRFANFGFVLPPTSTLEDIYEEPSTTARVIGKARVYSGVNILDETEYFYHIEYKGSDGYVLKNAVRTGEKAEALGLEYCHSICEIVTDGEPIYKEPDEASEAVCFAAAGKLFTIKQYLGDWYKVDNTIYAGYVRRDRVKNNRFLDDSYFFQKPGEHVSDLRLEILDYAFDWFGTPYVWGGETLGQGVDCSAYVWRVFQKFDIPMPRLSAEQAEWGKAVASMDDILPGDLLFYRGYNDAEKTWTEGVGHVAIYVGNGWMIHAASEARGITVDTYDYLDDPICIRRVITD
ncbi:MAG: C40 family peptidase [Lachnospiraceae bacterium]|nr:C40 family peptidase [Lachnospiraceae bacterium]